MLAAVAKPITHTACERYAEINVKEQIDEGVRHDADAALREVWNVTSW